MDTYDLAITAHDSKKDEVIQICHKYRAGIEQLSIAATVKTGLLIEQAIGIHAYLLEDGASGGYIQMAKLVAEHDVRMVIFLQDPLTINLDIPGIRTLLQECSIKRIPLASNMITAEFILHRYLEKKMSAMWRCPNHVHHHDLAQIANW